MREKYWQRRRWDHWRCRKGSLIDGPKWSRMTAAIEVDLPTGSALPSKHIPHLLLAGRQYVTAGQNCAWCSLVPKVLVYRRRQCQRNDDGKDGGLGWQTNGEGNNRGDHCMLEEWGASRWNASLGGGTAWLEVNMIHVASPARAACFPLHVHLLPQALPPLLAHQNAVRCLGVKLIPVVMPAACLRV